MRIINLDGLPEPVADAIEHLVEVLRKQFRLGREASGRGKLHTHKGTVIGELTREEIYRDVEPLGPDDAPKE
jgi:hypothetical protein